MRIISVGHAVFALAILGLAAFSLVTGYFDSNWPPVPSWITWREYFSYAVMLLMCAIGIGLLARQTAALASLVLAVLMLIWLLVLEVPRPFTVPHAAIADAWAGLGEKSMIIAGAWILYATLASQGDRPYLKYLAGEQGVRIAQILFALALLLSGQENFVYVKNTASLIPAWFPYRLGWAYLSGAGMVAAGLVLLFGALPRLAAILVASMMSVFTLLVWVYLTAKTPATLDNWAGIFISSSLSGAAWIVAESYRSASWFSRKKSRASSTAT